MAANEKKKVMGYDPLAWLGQETDDLVMDNVIDEIEPETVTGIDTEVQADIEAELGAVRDQLADIDSTVDEENFDSLTEHQSNPEIIDVDSSEIEMNVIADLPVSQVSNENAIEEVVESIINLDTTLTIQHVVNLHEKLKKSYSANNTIEINAAHVSSIDTSTLQLLVALKKDAIKQQKKVVFASPSRRFIESAELLGLLEILEIDASN
jgi:anti-anti-sigma regulatory factor